MSLEYFIAKRSAESKGGKEGKGGSKPSIMVRVATISVALSVAIIIISLAIVFGFKREVTHSLTGFVSEAILSRISTFNGAQDSPMSIDPALESYILSQKGAQSLSPYATLQGIVRSSESVEGVMLRGVDSLYDSSFLGSTLVEGALPRTSESACTRDVLLSQSLAQRLGLSLGSKVELLINEENRSLRRDLFKVCGLYSTGLDEWDRMVLVTDMRNVQRLKGWQRDQVSGYELRFGSTQLAATACLRINNYLLDGGLEGSENVMAITSQELYPSIFDWLKAHNVNALIIIIIMLIVAGFNMATALLIMVLERTRMIGILKSLGMNNKSLQRIFLFKALGITLRGLAWGNGVAILLCLMQQRYQFIELDAQSYLLTHLPIELGVGWLLLLNAVVVAAIWALMIIPARMVGRIEIEKTLKFE